MDDALEQIDRKVLQLFALVGESVAGATLALLSGDREAAKALADRDEVVDSLYHDIEQLTLEQLTVAGITSPSDLRFLVTVIRMVPDLERNGDLVPRARHGQTPVETGASELSRRRTHEIHRSSSAPSVQLTLADQSKAMVLEVNAIASSSTRASAPPMLQTRIPFFAPCKTAAKSAMASRFNPDCASIWSHGIAIADMGR